MSLHPYLFFTGTCREAMTRYQEIFGGELFVMSFDELPDGNDPPAPVDPEAVMHAALQFGDDLLMASDDPTGDGGGTKGVAVSVQLADPDEATRIFSALAGGGEVQMPLSETFFSPLFGTCTDRWGVAWMVNVVQDQG